MTKKKRISSEFYLFLSNLLEGENINIKNFIKEESLKDKPLTYLFISDLNKIYGKESDIQNIVNNDIDETVHFISLDTENLLADFKVFIYTIFECLLNNKNVLILYESDDIDLLRLIDIIYGFYITLAKKHTLNDSLNIGRLFIQLNNPSVEIIKCLAFRIILEKFIFNNILETANEMAYRFSQNKESEFYIKSKNIVDFISKYSINGIFLTNCFYNIHVEKNIFNKSTGNILNLINNQDDFDYLNIEIQSMYCYCINRTDSHLFYFFYKTISEKYNYIITKNIDDEIQEGEALLKIYLDKYPEVLRYDQTLYLNESHLSAIINLFESVKQNIKTG